MMRTSVYSVTATPTVSPVSSLMRCALTTPVGLGSLPRFLAVDESEQIGIHLVLERRAQTVRGALVDLQSRAFDELGLEQAGVGERHDLIVVALHDEGRHVDLLQVLGLIRLGEHLDPESSAGKSPPTPSHP